jgi:hypothetical protein
MSTGSTFLRVESPREALCSSGLALHDRIDGFQMAGIGNQTEMNAASVTEIEIGALTLMIFDVSRPTVGMGNIVAGEHGENFRSRLLHGVCEDVQSAPMRHTHDDFTDIPISRFGKQITQSGNQHFGAFPD